MKQINNHQAILSLASVVLAACSVQTLASPIDAKAAIAALAPTIHEFEKTCAPEKITAKASEVEITPAVRGELVVLTSSQGMCFGQPGENDYLLARNAKGSWRIAISAEPGVVQVDQPRKSRPASITVSGVGLCEIRYVWRNHRYGAKLIGCGTLVKTPHRLDDLAKVIALSGA